MKRSTTYIALSLGVLVSQLAFANNNCCEPKKEKPKTDCCEPKKPVDCINCECYLPPFLKMQCDWGVIAELDFLYMFSKENGLAYSTQITSQAATVGVDTRPVSTREFYFDADWDPGFRVGLGYRCPDHNWEFMATWTYFHNKTKRNNSVVSNDAIGLPVTAGDQTIVNFFTDGQLESSTLNDSVRAKWLLNFNVIDLSMASKFWFNKYLAMKPYFALRGAWTKVTLDFNCARNILAGDDIVTTYASTTRLYNRYWGVGFVAGTEADWHFTQNFSLFADADFSLLWGKFRTQRKNTFTQSVDEDLAYQFNVRNHYFGLQPILDLVAGFRWEDYFGANEYHFALDLGWEYHAWINHIKRKLFHRFNVDSEAGGQIDVPMLDEMQNDLMLSGFVARVRFDF